jgi:hypothetical protein
VPDEKPGRVTAGALTGTLGACNLLIPEKLEADHPYPASEARLLYGSGYCALLPTDVDP